MFFNSVNHYCDPPVFERDMCVWGVCVREREKSVSDMIQLLNDNRPDSS
jgi:hypothetical protein